MTRISLRFFWLTGSLALLLLLVLLALNSRSDANLLAGEEPLSAQQAFVPSISAVQDDALLVHFDIADGYYLYRDKTRFSLHPDNAGDQTRTESASVLTTGQPVFSAAELISDDFFGEQAIHRGEADIELPWSGSHDNGSARLEVSFQGCADMGLCYPPTTVELPVELPVPALATASTTATYTTLSSPSAPNVLQQSTNALPQSSVESRVGLFGQEPVQEELLPPELAYLPQIASANDRQIVIRWLIEPGYYLYRDKLGFSLDGVGDVRVASVDLDPGVEQYDDFFGNVRILRESAEASLYLDPAVDPDSIEQAMLTIDYQGCADIGVCFPPSQIQLPLEFDSTPSGLSLPVAANAQTDDRVGPDSNTAAGSLPLQSEQDRLFSALGDNSLWLTVGMFFGLGLLLAFTPCVLPMVPILSSLIVGQGQSMSTARAFRLSLVYVLVMASTYALVGIAVGLTGYNIQAFLQNPWVLSCIAVLFVLLSLAMFGFYELQMPAALQSRLTSWSNRQSGGQYTGVALMGFISTLIVGPCVTAPLAGALIYIARTGDALIGGAALFALGLGMGAPLLLIGTSAGRLLPRTGTWMNTTKQLFGILLLAMAIYMVSRFLPTEMSMGLFGMLAIMTAIYLGAGDHIDRDSSGWQRFGKGAGIVLGVYGLALLLGALSGNSSYRAPLKGMFAGASGSSESASHLAFEPVKSVSDLQQIVASASDRGQAVMLDFYADWCISCKEMEAFTFVDPNVQALLSNAVLIQADVTANDALDQAMLRQFDLFGPPGIIFYGADGVEIPAARVIGFMNAERFAEHLSLVFES